MRGLVGKRILVAGAGSGIGRELSIRLAEEGADVLVAGISKHKLPQTAELAIAAALAAGRTNHVATHAFDIAESVSIAELIQACSDKLGGLDGVVIPAAEVGLASMRADVALPDADPAIWDRVMHVNITGHMMLMQAALPLLKAAGGGSIVTISSMSAYLGRPSLPAYAASKAGLHGLIRHVARLAGADGIRCNGVAPGLVMEDGRELPDPDMTKIMLEGQSLKRIGRYTDIAGVIAFLLSDDAGWITGQVISANGGFAFRD
ncbi:SDR family NAD(P)-dependent oxidoreductase [Sphingomonas montanisoli]|nr:SDR family oxidoreductase [Sphingomonas montanisoli]